MKITKINDTYGEYRVEISFGQLVAIKNALAVNHADPISDEMYAELEWYLQNIPGPGESKEDLTKAEDAITSGMDSDEAEGQPLKANADDLVPPPGAEQGPPDEGAGEEPAGDSPASHMQERPSPHSAAGAAGSPAAKPNDSVGAKANERVPPPPED